MNSPQLAVFAHPVLATARCVLRPIASDDADRLHALWSSLGVRRFLWDGEIIPLEQTRAAIEQSRRMFDEHRFGLWGAWTAGSHDLVGFSALWWFRDPPELELLYGVAEPLWGKGYAAEIAQAVVRHCVTTLEMPVVRASTDIGNTASIRVLDKLGFTFVRRATVGGLDTVFYERATLDPEPRI